MKVRPRRHQCLWIRLTAASMWVKVAWLPAVYMLIQCTPSIGGKGRCCTRCDLWYHCMQARKSAGERSTPDLKSARKETRSPKQEQSVAPQTAPWSNKILFKFFLKLIRFITATEKETQHAESLVVFPFILHIMSLYICSTLVTFMRPTRK